MIRSGHKRTVFSTFDPIMFPKGFERKRSVYHRVVNRKIIQMLGFMTEGGGYYFQTTFEIEPLCIGGETSRCIDAARLEQFKIPHWEYRDLGAVDK